MPNVKILEFPEAMSGHEMYEIEFPFVAFPVSGGDAIKCSVSTSTTFSAATIL